MTPGPARDYLDYLTDIVDAATKAVAFVIEDLPPIVPLLQQLLNDISVKEGESS